MNKSLIAPAFVAAIMISACAPNEPPPVASTPVAARPGDRIISGPAPMPSPGSMPDTSNDYMRVGRDPVPNLPDEGAWGSPDDKPYGSW